MKLPWDRPELDARGLADSSPPPISRRDSLLRGAMGFAGMLALIGCASSDSASMGPMAERQKEENQGNSPEDPPPVVAGEALDGVLLRRFYVRRDFEPVWATREAEARAFTAAVLRARDHGLDPELFHADLLRRMDSFPPDRRELLLTHAVLTFVAICEDGRPRAVDG